MTLDEKRALLVRLQEQIHQAVETADKVDEAFLMKTLPEFGIAANAVLNECKEHIGLLNLARDIATDGRKTGSMIGSPPDAGVRHPFFE